MAEVLLIAWCVIVGTALLCGFVLVVRGWVRRKRELCERCGAFPTRWFNGRWLCRRCEAEAEEDTFW